MNEYQGCIRDFVHSAAERGCKTLVLVGDNDLEFLFDYACRFCKLAFIKIDSEHFFNDRFFVTDDAVIVFSDENRYEAFAQTDGFSDFEEHCTTVIGILRSAESLLV